MRVNLPVYGLSRNMIWDYIKREYPGFEWDGRIFESPTCKMQYVNIKEGINHAH